MVRAAIHGFGLFAILSAGASAAQSTNPPKETVKDGCAIHQPIDIGGRIVDHYGSGNMTAGIMWERMSAPHTTGTLSAP